MDKRVTKRFNTPCSPAWDDAWIATVEKTEREHGRAVCGARTPAGTPCRLPPNHENGRCRYHGGFNLTGAQPGNRNAVKHGLYLRALQHCGPSCPRWGHCPIPTKDLDKIPDNNRPVCPYETLQYQTALTDGFDRLARKRNTDTFHTTLVYHTALLQVMVNRAATALTTNGFATTITANGDTQTPKLSPAFTAYSRLSAQLYRYLKLLDNTEDAMHRNHHQRCDFARRSRVDTDLTPEGLAQLDTPADPGEFYANRYYANLQNTLNKIRQLNQDAEKDRQFNTKHNLKPGDSWYRTPDRSAEKEELRIEAEQWYKLALDVAPPDWQATHPIPQIPT